MVDVLAMTFLRSSLVHVVEGSGEVGVLAMCGTVARKYVYESWPVFMRRIGLLEGAASRGRASCLVCLALTAQWCL